MCAALAASSPAGWTYNYLELEDIQLILLRAAPGRRSPSSEKHGSILAEWLRTQRSLKTLEDGIIRRLVSEAGTMTPSAPVSVRSDLPKIVTTLEPAESAAAQSRLKDFEA